MHATAFEELASTFAGDLIRPRDDRYESARRIWNGMIDKRPALIARCTGAADVVAALDFARQRDLPVAVRGGGHNVAGHALCDDGVVIDLSGQKSIGVDPVARTARAQPGVTWGELDRETQHFGLATTGGEVSTTGIAGLTLGGGFGWLARRYATACDNLLSADVVTAAGEVVTASASENSDLFWGLRGGGGNFGIVTSFEYQLHPLGQVLAGPILYPFERAAEVLRSFGDYLMRAPDELSAIAAIFTAPPPEVHGRLVIAVNVCYSGDPRDAEKAVGPLRSLGRPLADLVTPVPYTAFQKASDESVPPGLHNYWKSSYLSQLTDEAVDTVVAHAAQITSPQSIIAIERLGGAVSRVDADATAFGHRDAAFDFRALSLWRDPSESDTHIAWTRELWTAMQPFSTGAVYVNNLGDEGEDRVKAAYAPATYERLVALKDEYDPENRFRLNQNIRPSRSPHDRRVEDTMPKAETTYLLAGQDSELERLRLQSPVWEPSGRRLLAEIGDGRGARALDVGCGVLGWLRVLSEWVGPDGEVTGTDIDDAMLAAADRFASEEGLRNVGLVKDDLFASELESDSFDLVHARAEICPLGRAHEQMQTYVRLARPGGTIVLEDPDTGSWHFNPPAPALERLIALVEEAFLARGGDWRAGRNHLHLLREFGIQGNVRAEVVALPPGHPYLRLPLQFADSMEEQLRALVSADELEQLREQGEAELREPGRWGTTFTLLQCWGAVQE